MSKPIFLTKTEKTYEQENQILFESFLNSYFYNSWGNSNPKSFELIVSPKCNLGCSYCYIHKNNNKLFETQDVDNILDNLDYILKYLDYNNFNGEFNIFSGELLSQKIGYELLEKIYLFYKDKPREKKIKIITIPTNFTFLCDTDCTNRIQQIIDNYREIGINLFLSASVDGKYAEKFRSYKKDLDYCFKENYATDDWYDKVFSFMKKNGYGPHPMIYNKAIFSWKENFNWWQSMLEKYDMDWENLYLLQVRNNGWTVEENKEFYSFIRYIINWAFEKCGKDKDKFYHFLRKKKGFNLLTVPFAKVSRGTTCGMQLNLCIRAEDLKTFPCHRLMYKDFMICNWEKDAEKGLVPKVKNAELGLTTYGCNFKSFPICIECPIRSLCNGGCLGAQFESTGSMFTPIPSVCKNFYYSIKAVIDGLDEIGVTDLFIDLKDFEIKRAVEILRSLDI